MTVKSQLSACRDSIMAGMRAAARGATPNERVDQVLRACLDLVEHMERQSATVTTAEVGTTLAVLERAAAELESEALASNAVLIALQNAIGRLQSLRAEIGTR